MNYFEAVIDRIKKAGVTHVVMQADVANKYGKVFGDWIVKTIFDRRSMTYFAMGVSQELKKPVLLVLDNSTDISLADAFAGITEAYYQNIPLFILAIQNKEGILRDNLTVIGDKCVYSCTISEKANGFEECDVVKINYSISALKECGGGPVFVELCCLNSSSKVDLVPVIKIISEAEFYVELTKLRKKILQHPIHLVLDATEKYSYEDMILLVSFCRKYNATISERDVYFALNYLPVREYKDDSLIIEFGNRHTYSISDCDNENWIVTPELRVDRVSKLHIRVMWRDFVKMLLGEQIISVSKKNKKQRIDNSWSIKSIVYAIIKNINQKAWVSGFDINGVNICDILSYNPLLESASYMDCSSEEGNLSMFIGQSIAADRELSLCLIDQDKYFRDMNALHIQSIGVNVRIVFFGNEEETEKALSWASSCGFDTIKAKDYESLNSSLQGKFLTMQNKPVILAIII